MLEIDLKNSDSQRILGVFVFCSKKPLSIADANYYLIWSSLFGWKISRGDARAKENLCYLF